MTFEQSIRIVLPFCRIDLSDVFLPICIPCVQDCIRHRMPVEVHLAQVVEHPDDVGRLRTLPCQAIIVSEGDEHLRHIPAVLKQAALKSTVILGAGRCCKESVSFQISDEIRREEMESGLHQGAKLLHADIHIRHNNYSSFPSSNFQSKFRAQSVISRS